MLSHIWFLMTPRTATCQAPLSMEDFSKNTGVGCHFLLQGIFLTQGWNPSLLCLLQSRQILYHWLTWVLKCIILLRHLNVSGRKTYYIKMIATWYINFFTLCLQGQLCWLCYYHNFSFLTTVLVYTKQITYSVTLIVLN